MYPLHSVHKVIKILIFVQRLLSVHLLVLVFLNIWQRNLISCQVLQYHFHLDLNTMQKEILLSLLKSFAFDFYYVGEEC